MDQIKTGRFISQMRREKNLTQRQLAESLGITDKTVSKWETGRGLPEVSLMMPLCELLDISVNELLSGEKIAEKDYRRRSEEVIMDLMREKEENKRKVILSVVTVLNTLLASLTIILITEFVDMETWTQALLIVIGLVVLVTGLFTAAALEWNAGTYECRHCKARFTPTAGAYMAGMHTITRRHLKCPECGKKSWCKRRLTH